MAVIQLREFTPPAGSEWSSTSYPGEGAYLTPFGVFVVFNNCVWGLNSPGWERLVSGARATSTSGDVDIHRLLDQMIELTAGKK